MEYMSFRNDDSPESGNGPIVRTGEKKVTPDECVDMATQAEAPSWMQSAKNEARTAVHSLSQTDRDCCDSDVHDHGRMMGPAVEVAMAPTVVPVVRLRR